MSFVVAIHVSPLVLTQSNFAEPFGDWSSVPSSRLAFSYTTRFDSIDSAFSSEAPSSASGSFDILPSSSNSPNSFPSVDYTLPDLYFPQQAISTSPLSMLDSTDYFSAYLFAPSTSIDAPPTIPSDLSKGITYPSCDFDLLSLFPASQPAPKVVKHEPSYFGMPPPIEKQEWPQEMKSGGGLEVVGGLGIPLTPGWSIDYTALGALF